MASRGGHPAATRLDPGQGDHRLGEPDHRGRLQDHRRSAGHRLRQRDDPEPREDAEVVSRPQLSALLVSLAGVAVSIYLTLLHYAGVVPGCPLTGPINCEAVLSSSYAVIGGTAVPTSAAGIIWFGVSALLWIRPPGRAHLVWSGIGLATVLYLVFIEIVRLGVICLWCTAAHVLVVVILLIALASRPATNPVRE
ncbi:MAG: vitamin K epoxide reductase family protein [Chloroflexi bacterium]|nr:MAG: vitamin K epoxide reductase family protein [Chloroflexota bacterium]